MGSAADNRHDEHQSFSAFLESSLVIRAVEAHLIGGVDNGDQMVGHIKRWIIFPKRFLGMGIDELLRGPTVWSFLTLALAVGAMWAIPSLGLAGTDAAGALLFLAPIIPLFLVTFATPSTYANSGLCPRHIDFVVRYLRSRGITLPKQIELLRRSIKPFDERTRARVTILKWLVGISWAVCIFMLTKAIDAPLADPATLLEHVLKLGLTFLFCAAAFVCIWGYEAALDKLFRAIEFGLNDFCSALVDRADNPTTSP